MSTTLKHTTTLVTTACWCGIALAIPDSLWRMAKKDPHHSVYCPLGHAFVYGGPTEADRLRERLADEQALSRRRADEVDRERRRHSATKGQLTKAKKRAARGVCPCCTRSFVNVQRHIEGQHPEYVENHG